MSAYQYLQLQPVEPDENDSPLDEFAQDETIDLTQDEDESQLDRSWARAMSAMQSDDNTTSDDKA